MPNFKKRKRIKKILYSKPILSVLFLVFLFSANAAWEMYQKAKVAYGNRDMAEKKLLEFKQREEALLAKVSRLKTPEGVEAEIREKFGLVKEGEEVVIIVDESEKKDKNSESTVFSSAKKWWNDFLDIFR